MVDENFNNISDSNSDSENEIETPISQEDIVHSDTESVTEFFTEPVFIAQSDNELTNDYGDEVSEDEVSEDEQSDTEYHPNISEYQVKIQVFCKQMEGSDSSEIALTEFINAKTVLDSGRTLFTRNLQELIETKLGYEFFIEMTKFTSSEYNKKWEKFARELQELALTGTINDPKEYCFEDDCYCEGCGGSPDCDEEQCIIDNTQRYFYPASLRLKLVMVD